MKNKTFIGYIKTGLVILMICVFALPPYGFAALNKILVFQSDFGLRDGAVSAMKGVAMGVDSDLKLFDITHDIPACSVWDAGYRLYQTVPFWPEGTVFVSVVDPGVGSERKSVVAKLSGDRYVVTPDNGTLTFLMDQIEEVREIDESINRLPGSTGQNTFHGRDIYSYTAARLASGVIRFEEVGPILREAIVKLPVETAEILENSLVGSIEILDIQYGNVWSNVPFRMAQDAYGMTLGKEYNVSIRHNGEEKYRDSVMFCNSFSEVAEGESLLYVNSLSNLAIALNMGNFAETYGVGYGEGWTMEISVSSAE